MWQNIFKLSLFVSLAAVTLVNHIPQVSTTILKGNSKLPILTGVPDLAQIKVTSYRDFWISRLLGGFVPSSNNQHVSGGFVPPSNNQQESAAVCDMIGNQYVKVGNKFYYFSESQATWYKAFLNCRAMGGFLASFDNQQDLTAVSDYLIAKYSLQYWWWLSGSDQDVESDFYWYNTGERIGFADWSVGQPDNNGGNENCVIWMYKDPKYQMIDRKCKQSAYYICEADNCCKKRN